MKIGDPLPEFSLPINGGTTLTTKDLLGKSVILYFYPKDLTPGCTTEAIDFSTHIEEFDRLGAVVIGVSKDTVDKHEKFIAKHDLKVTLISDEDGTLCEAFETWVEKKMYGKTYMGIERATFLFNPELKLNKIWRKVKVKGHVEEVLTEIKESVN